VLRLLAVAAALAAPLGGGPLERDLVGRSVERRPIQLYAFGPADARFRLLVVGCIHGDECAGTAVTRRLLRTAAAPVGVRLLVVQNLNPDGYVRGTRWNGRGVDLNRNFGSEWRPGARSGRRPWSEPEARLARRLVERLGPAVTIWFHQPQALVRAWGPSVGVARVYARLAGMPYRSLRWPHGSGPNWQNHRFPDDAAFVVELPAGRLSAAAAERHVHAIIGLRRALRR
jgi:protein MpaA